MGGARFSPGSTLLVRLSVASAFVLAAVPTTLIAQTPAWRSSLEGIEVPAHPVRGRIRGVAIVAVRATYDGHVLEISPWLAAASGRDPWPSLRIYLAVPLLLPEATFAASEISRNVASPHIHVAWRAQGDVLGASTVEQCVEERAARVELRRRPGGGIDGGVYACLDDGSVLAGTFEIGSSGISRRELRTDVVRWLTENHPGARVIAVRERWRPGLPLMSKEPEEGAVAVEFVDTRGAVDEVLLRGVWRGPARSFEILDATRDEAVPQAHPRLVPAAGTWRFQSLVAARKAEAEIRRRHPGKEVEDVSVRDEPGSSSSIACGVSTDDEGMVVQTSWGASRFLVAYLLRGDVKLHEECFEVRWLRYKGGPVPPAEANYEVEPCAR